MANRYTILVVEDEVNIASFMTTILTANDYRVIKAKNGSEAMMQITSQCPDVMLLDLGLPDMDGQSIIKSVREWSAIPIIVVSARTHERDKVEALDLGADDYVTKPFGTSELLARVRTALRHRRTLGTEDNSILTGKFKVRDLVIDYDKRHVFLAGEDIRLTQTEFNIVALLAQFAGRVLTYDYLIKYIWGPGSDGNNQILRVNMANIRRKMVKNPAEPVYILTEMGVGYRMIDNE